jgi:predicted DNA-binding transcriptional regulator AlpA
MQFTETQNVDGEGFLRLHQVIGCRKRGIPALIPISQSGWYKKIADGIYPPGVLIGSRTRAYSRASIRQLLEDMKAGKAR